jgi:cell division protease FtsH
MANQNNSPDSNNPFNRPESNKGSGRKRNNTSIWIFAVIGIGLIIMQFFSFGDNTKEISQNRFENNMLLTHDVEKVIVINEKRAEVYIKKTSQNKPEFKDIKKTQGNPFFKGEDAEYYFTIGSLENFENRMDLLQKDFSTPDRISISFEKQIDYTSDIISWLLPIIIIVLIWVFIFRRMGGGAMGGGGIFNIGKSKAKLFDQEQTVIKTNFSDVAGLEEAKVEIAEIVDFLKNPEKYTQLGGKIPKGALLVGPPGTGKTLLAKAVAGEANVPFFSMSGSDFVEMFVGVGASRVRDLFAQAKQKAPCIVFIDEIDAVGRARGRNVNMSSNDERENTLNQLLTEMDGFDTNSGVILLAATNRADVLDPALLRAGRFDRQIHVELPDLTEREKIFKVHLKPIKVDTQLDSENLAKQTPGFSGADIANVCNEAALIAARNGKSAVDKQDFLDAIDRIIGGLEKKSKIITFGEKKTIAYHEAGHATVSWLLEFAHPLIKVTIVPRGQALGAAWYQPHERQITTKEQILDEMCSALAGRASEELIFNKISTGALNDLERVSKQAYAMIAFYGMSDEVGNVSFFDSTGSSDYAFQKPYSDKTAELIDTEVKKLITEQYIRAQNLLTENRTGLEQLAELLLTREVIFSEDLENVFGKRKFKDEYAEEIRKVQEKRKAEEELKRQISEKSEKEETARKEQEENPKIKH